MTNILLLTKFNGPGTSFSVNNNEDWTDEITFLFSGYPQLSPIQIVAAIVSGTNIVTVAASTSTSSLIAGMPIVQIPGIPNDAFIGTVTSNSAFTMVDGQGNPLDATASNPNVALTIKPLPLDLTGIKFTADLRLSPQNPQVLLALSTVNGTLINGEVNGTLSFSVPAAQMFGVPAATYVMDIVATADNHTINLCEGGPATVTVLQGVTGVA